MVRQKFCQKENMQRLHTILDTKRALVIIVPTLCPDIDAKAPADSDLHRCVHRCFRRHITVTSSGRCGVPNHRQFDSLFNGISGLASRNTSIGHNAGLLWVESFSQRWISSQRANDAERVSISWRHHDKRFRVLVPRSSAISKWPASCLISTYPAVVKIEKHKQCKDFLIYSRIRNCNNNSSKSSRWETISYCLTDSTTSANDLESQRRWTRTPDDIDQPTVFLMANVVSDK